MTRTSGKLLIKVGSETIPSPLGTKPPQTNNPIRPFTRQKTIGQSYLTKMFGSCSSKLDG